MAGCPFFFFLLLLFGDTLPNYGRKVKVLKKRTFLSSERLTTIAGCPLFGPGLSIELKDVRLLLNLKGGGVSVTRAEQIMGLRRDDEMMTYNVIKESREDETESSRPFRVYNWKRGARSDQVPSYTWQYHAKFETR